MSNVLVFVLSGGSSNVEPDKALGGDPSDTAITNNSINNLFDDLTTTDTDEGSEDYRCFYIFNDGTIPLYNLRLWIYEDFAVSSSLELGVKLQDETQRITLIGPVTPTRTPPTSGFFVFSYDGKTITSSWRENLNTWAAELQASLLALTDDDDEPYFSSVSVNAQVVNISTIIFDIVFSQLDGKRRHSLFQVEQNVLLPTTEIAISYLQAGYPINVIAPTINVETTTPGGVDFYAPTENSPIVFPRLSPGDGVPVWVRRTTAAGSVARSSDGFSLRILADEIT
jgi:hypothetical protein